MSLTGDRPNPLRAWPSARNVLSSGNTQVQHVAWRKDHVQPQLDDFAVWVVNVVIYGHVLHARA